MATKFVAMSLAALVLLSLMATTILAMEANDGLASAFIGMEVDASGGKGACCDQCPCTRSIPPQCRCGDIKTKCHSACKQCVCTRSIPPQCRCTDITGFCYPRCTTENGEDMLN